MVPDEQGWIGDIRDRSLMACMDAVGVPHGREPIQLPRKTSGILELFVNRAVGGSQGMPAFEVVARAPSPRSRAPRSTQCVSRSAKDGMVIGRTGGEVMAQVCAAARHRRGVIDREVQLLEGGASCPADQAADELVANH